jgi:hypothetical protein
MENASGRDTLKKSVLSSLKQLALRPHRFLLSKPFGLVFVSNDLLNSSDITNKI